MSNRIVRLRYSGIKYKEKYSVATLRAFTKFAKREVLLPTELFGLHKGTGECVCIECERFKELIERILRASTIV
jgi:hypothetical protein